MEKIEQLIKQYELNKQKGKLGEYALGRLAAMKTCLNILKQEKNFKTLL